MGLLNFLFPKVKNTKKTIFDFFQINIKELPDSSFIDEGTQYDKDGGEFRFYTNTLDYLECGIFNEIEVTKWDNFICIEFCSKPSTNLNVNKFCELANSLYSIYGKDDSNEGIITSQEISDYLTYGGAIARFWYLSNHPMISITAFSALDNIISLQVKDISLKDTKDENSNKTINELFRTNLKELPDKRFNANGFVSSDKVAGFYSFDLTLDYLECGIFNEINVHQHPEGGMTVFFTSTDLLNVKLETVKELVDSLFNLYGLDSEDKGKFTEQEKNEFYGHHESSLRSWLNPELPFEFIDIEVDRENNEISLTIIISKAD